MSDYIRINKFIAERLGHSRRQADQLIDQGRVEIDGDTAKIGARITPNSIVKIDGQTVEHQANYQYLMLHKPVGYVCSRRHQGDTPTIFELLPTELRALKPVGRLDKDSSGLLLLTNDGDFAHQMTHPSFYKVKIYEVELDKPLQPLHRQMISDFGVNLEDGSSQFQLERMIDSDDHKWRVTMSEGRNRQIRRTFDAVGYTVTKLHRTNFGSYSLNGLELSKTRKVQPK